MQFVRLNKNVTGRNNAAHVAENIESAKIKLVIKIIKAIYER